MVEYITRKGYDKLYQAYLDVDSEIAETQAKMGNSAKIDNDLRENPEYMSLRVKLMYELPQKKKRLYESCKNSIIIEDMEEYKNFDGTTVIIGSEVQLLIDDEEECYKILGNCESDLDDSVMSCVAPLAQAILNKCVGDKIKFRNMDICILSVKRI